jgi:hypothetical protein
MTGKAYACLQAAGAGLRARETELSTAADFLFAI